MTSFRSPPPFDPPNLDNLWSCNFGHSFGRSDNFDSCCCCNFGYFDSTKRPGVRQVDPNAANSWAQHHRNLRVECTPNATPFLGRNHGDSHGKTNSNPKRALPAVPVWTNWIYQSQDPCWKLPSNPSLASRCWAHPGVISDKRHRGFCC